MEAREQDVRSRVSACFAPDLSLGERVCPRSQKLVRIVTLCFSANRVQIGSFLRARTCAWLVLAFLSAFLPRLRAQQPAPEQTNQISRVIEAAGTVEFSAAGNPVWTAARAGLALKPGDRLRTAAESRAAVQFSDRSIMRIGERSVLEIHPPLHSEKRRFRLGIGSLFFFHRGSPADVEFESPVVSGAIRGTEFALLVDEATGATRLPLIDGAVELQSGAERLNLVSGEEAVSIPGQPLRKSPLLDVRRVIQWALYYPAVLIPEEIPFSPQDRAALSDSLQLYRTGDLLGALATARNVPPNGPAYQIYRAALDLAVGQVATAEQRLTGLDPGQPAVRALRELITAVRAGEGHIAVPSTTPQTASEWLARSYLEQSAFQLEAARTAAARAVALAPQSGFARARLAELEFSFGNKRAAEARLAAALQLSPRFAPAYSLKGFIALDRKQAQAALVAFNDALAVDSALGNAWLGRGLALMMLRDREESLRSLETAAALEPQRSLPRSYLGKAYSESKRNLLAERELRLAKQLDPNDPTPWLYAALHLWRENRVNEAIRSLEESSALNDNRALFRSRLLLEQDRAVRSADLAAIYHDAGMEELARRAAAHSIDSDYAEFSGHLFLSRSFSQLEDPNRFNLRFETVRESEQLLANLLAPSGAGNLSRFLSQSEHLRFFDVSPVGASSLTEYRTDGDWLQTASVFGSIDGFSYALDGLYESSNGDQPNGSFERRDVSLQLKQRITQEDELFLQAGYYRANAGDVARYYDPNQAKRDFHVEDTQEPSIFLGYHRSWSPGSHTLLLLSRLPDQLTLHDAQPNLLFLRQSGGAVQSVETPPDFVLDFDSAFALYSAELQQIYQTANQNFVVGGRFQHADVRSSAMLNRSLPPTVADDHINEPLTRGSAYAYDFWQVAEPLRLIAGVSYDHLKYPKNADIAPLTHGTDERDLVAPKVGLDLTPWHRGLLRASYTRSLGGLYFDNSVRLEPTQIAGFNQAFRSLIPESVVGLVPGTRFHTANVGFDQSLKTGTYFGIEADWLVSDATRVVGALSNGGILPVPDTATTTQQTLDFRECNVSFYAFQMIGDQLSVGARYRLSEAVLHSRFPDLPPGLQETEGPGQNEKALLHRVGLSLNYEHPSGLFGSWESAWYHQDNTAFADEDLWQHNLFLGYRFGHRMAELRVGVLNLFDTDYRLNPLNLETVLPRHRTGVVSLRLNF